MKILRLFVFWILCVSSLKVFASSQQVEFSPNEKVKVVLVVRGNELQYAIFAPGKNRRGSLAFDTEKPVHVEVDDYDFSGMLGFSVWYVDGGKGIYTIHRVFVLSKNSESFEEEFPECGDEFINLRVDKKHRRLISMYYFDNEPKECVTRLRTRRK